MRQTIARRINLSKLMALLVFMLTLPMSAHAILYDYTYTGKPFDLVGGPDYPPPDASPSYFISLHFTYDGDLPPYLSAASVIPSLSISDGDHVLGALSAPISYCSLNFLALDADTNLPAAWDIRVQGGEPGPYLTFESIYLIGNLTIDASYMTLWPFDPGGMPPEGNHATIRNSPGEWARTPVAPVPVPATLLLLGSGLVGLAATRYHKRS